MCNSVSRHSQSTQVMSDLFYPPVLAWKTLRYSVNSQGQEWKVMIVFTLPAWIVLVITHLAGFGVGADCNVIFRNSYVVSVIVRSEKSVKANSKHLISLCSW